MRDFITILHAADLHLDSPFEGLPDEPARMRRGELRRLPEKLAALAGARKADLVLLAGDLLDSGSPYRETGEALFTALGKIEAPVFIAPGNHDYYAPRSPYARLSLPENVRVFGSAGLECAEIPELGLRVWGAGFTQEHSPPLLSGFSLEKKAGFLDVCVLHGDALNPSSPYNPVSAGDLAQSGFDYAALGHSHTYAGLKRAGGTRYAWPGCPEGRGFDETGEKGVLLVRLGRSGDCESEFVPLGGRKYEILAVDVTDKPPLRAVLEALPGDTERDYYRVLLAGETEEAPDLGSLAAALEGRFFRLQLRDGTSLRRPLWERCGEDSLRGLFLSKLKAQLDAAGDEGARERATLAARYGLLALDNGEEPGM